MSRLATLGVLLALVGAPLLALDRVSEPGMPCCEGDPCAQEIGQAPECCAVSPAAPDERPALNVERAVPSILAVASVWSTLRSPSGISLAARLSPAPLDTSPSRPVVLRL